MWSVVNQYGGVIESREKSVPRTRFQTPEKNNKKKKKKKINIVVSISLKISQQRFGGNLLSHVRRRSNRKKSSTSRTY